MNVSRGKSNRDRESLTYEYRDRPKLIIFDCDGVLVQSEEITLSVLASMTNALLNADSDTQQPLNVTDFIERYRGRKIGDCLQEIQRELGIKFPCSFEDEFREESLIALTHSLKATDGVIEVLQGLRTPMCVASSAPRTKIEHCLQLTELYGFFEGNIFSCYELGRWKPDPLVFITACKYNNVNAGDALVIEDSVTGVQAAIAADIRVLGFGPIDRHLMLADAGALPFSNMRDLLAILG